MNINYKSAWSQLSKLLFNQGWQKLYLFFDFMKIVINLSRAFYELLFLVFYFSNSALHCFSCQLQLFIFTLKVATLFF